MKHNCKTCNKCKWAGGGIRFMHVVLSNGQYVSPYDLCFKAPIVRLDPVEGIQREYVKCRARNTLKNPCQWWNPTFPEVALEAERIEATKPPLSWWARLWSK